MAPSEQRRKKKGKGRGKKKKGSCLPIWAPQKKSGKMVFTTLVSREYSSRRLSFRSTLKISKRDSQSGHFSKDITVQGPGAVGKSVRVISQFPLSPQSSKPCVWGLVSQVQVFL